MCVKKFSLFQLEYQLFARKSSVNNKINLNLNFYTKVHKNLHYTNLTDCFIQLISYLVNCISNKLFNQKYLEKSVTAINKRLRMIKAAK